MAYITTYDGAFAEVNLPYLAHDGEIELTWEFVLPEQGAVTEYSYYDIVTPLLTNDEVLDIHPNATEDEIRHIERAVRHIINAHTGQQFGRTLGPKTISGNGSTALALPQRLLKLNKIDGLNPSADFVVQADGWVLIKAPFGVPPIKADAWGLHMHRGGVIHNPYNVRLANFESREYIIEGEWGWKYVPQQVKEAAKLLVNDYACADASYRDRFIQAMTAADWRIQFNSGAFVKTGNVRADQLLSNYVLPRGWMVI